MTEGSGCNPSRTHFQVGTKLERRARNSGSRSQWAVEMDVVFDKSDSIEVGWIVSELDGKLVQQAKGNP